ncbi:MAG: acyltransferase family protein [Actinocatenispora sp.]
MTIEAADGRSGDRGGHFRGDVEGLRAVAIGAVLLYHAGVAPLTGGYIGVDVFFVISGFLITGLLLREATRTGSVSFTAFYARRMKRLLPMTLLVLAVVVVASWLVMSPVDRKVIAWDVIAAALYVVNWRLAGQAVDYSALGAHASPVQHFWSLAVEEQFYIVWPLLVLLVAVACRGRSPARLRGSLAVVLGVLCAASLAYSIYLTHVEAGAAYFSTLTRSWELAVGGLVALCPRLRLPRRLGGILALVGIGLILVSIVDFNDDTRFPGAVALLPVLGTATVILVGSASTDTMVARVLSLPPLRHVGRVSYSWYLWHWPAIVFVTAWLGTLSTRLSVLVALLSYVPALLTYQLVENRFRHARVFVPRRAALALGTACTAGAVMIGAMSLYAAPTLPAASRAEAAGASELEHPVPQKSVTKLRPRPEDAPDDRGRMVDDGCILGQHETRSPACVYGDASSDTTVVLFGDSHAMQYFPALEPIAKRRHWRLVGLTKSACTPADVSTYNVQFKREYFECAKWREATLDRILHDEHPDLVITGNLATEPVMRDGRRLDSKEGAQEMREGYARTLRRVRDSGSQAVVLQDNPHPPWDVPSCVSQYPKKLDRCSFSTTEGLRYEPVDVAAVRQVEGVQLIDPTPVMCPNGTCAAVTGNVLIYRNGTHITATYMETLTDWLDRQLPVL